MRPEKPTAERYGCDEQYHESSPFGQDGRWSYIEPTKDQDPETKTGHEQHLSQVQQMEGKDRREPAQFGLDGFSGEPHRGHAVTATQRTALPANASNRAHDNENLVSD